MVEGVTRRDEIKRPCVENCYHVIGLQAHTCRGEGQIPIRLWFPKDVGKGFAITGLGIT